jgi:hypothetical protein
MIAGKKALFLASALAFAVYQTIVTGVAFSLAIGASARGGSPLEAALVFSAMLVTSTVIVSGACVLVDRLK